MMKNQRANLDQLLGTEPSAANHSRWRTSPFTEHSEYRPLDGDPNGDEDD